MKIAIQGHPTKGKEVIQILESLGGKNVEGLKGTYESFYYIDDKNEICDDHKKNFPTIYKLFTLEEFEKAFPFKVGDIIFHKGHKAIVEKFIPREHCYYIRYNNPPIDGCYYTKWTTALELKMKEERNITLTLDKAKEWYNKGGELKEVALQAYSEEELNKVELPKTWEKFCKNYPVKAGESWVGTQDFINTCTNDLNQRTYKNWTPSKKSAEAHLAMMQLEQLRNCYNNSSNDINRIAIINNNGNVELYINPPFNCFLTFKNHLLAKEFFSNFKEIIEIAKELI